MPLRSPSALSSQASSNTAHNAVLGGRLPPPLPNASLPSMAHHHRASSTSTASVPGPHNPIADAANAANAANATTPLTDLLATPTTPQSSTTISSKELHQNISDDIYHTIVRIVVHSAEFDYELPFKIKGNLISSGTGFFIDDKGHLLTCSHVVQDASHVYIEIPSEGKKQYRANVLGICPKFDLAVVRIEGYTNKHYCHISEADGMDDSHIKPGDETYALGFPLGQDNLKVTKGIISGQQENMYQIDTPINPGNSGGPLLKNNTVIGVNGAGVLMANNIGYAVPISRYFLLGKLLYQPKHLIHFPEIFGFEYQRTSQEFVDYLGYSCTTQSSKTSKSLKSSNVSKASKASKASNAAPSSGRTTQRTSSTSSTTTTRNTRHRRRVAASSGGGRRSRRNRRSRARRPHRHAIAGCSGQGGVYIKRTFPQSPVAKLSPQMQQGDILCAINDIALDHYGEFDRRWMNQKMSLSNMLCTLPLNKPVKLSYWSAKQKALMNRSFVLKEYDIPIRARYPEFEPLDYEVIAGMAVMPLCLDHCNGLFVTGRILKYNDIEHRHEPRVVVSSVLVGSDLAASQTIEKNAVLAEVNNQKVRTIEDFRAAFRKPVMRKGKRYLKLKTEGRNIAVLSMDTILQEEAHLQEVYKYRPSALLKGLRQG